MINKISLLADQTHLWNQIDPVTGTLYPFEGRLVMGINTFSEGLHDLVDELRQLETFFPMLGISGEREELEEEVSELEELIRAAGIPEDEHSQRALTYLQAELARKRGFLARLD